MMLISVRTSMIIAMFVGTCLSAGDYNSFDVAGTSSRILPVTTRTRIANFFENRAADCFVVGSVLTVVEGIAWGVGVRAQKRAYDAQNCNYGRVDPRIQDDTDTSKKLCLTGCAFNAAGIALFCIGQKFRRWGNSIENESLPAPSAPSVELQSSYTETKVPTPGDSEADNVVEEPSDLEVGAVSVWQATDQRVYQRRKCIAETAREVCGKGCLAIIGTLLVDAFFVGISMSANRCFYVDADGYCRRSEVYGDYYLNPQTQISDAYHRIYGTHIALSVLGSLTYVAGSISAAIE